LLLYGLEKDPDFRHIDIRLLTSCPASDSDEGGLFLLDFQHNRLKKLYTGGCMGMARASGRLIVATCDSELIALDGRFQTVAKTKCRKLDFHGMARWSEDVVLVVETAINAIGCYETATLSRIGEIRLNPADKDVHHLNDIWLEGRTLYVSMFSPYERWYLNPTEKSGGIVAIDLSAFRPDRRLVVVPANSVIVSGLYMPHTVMVHDGELVYCDSMSFRVCAGKETTIQVAGFTRGLAFAGDTIFIGQSRMRHVLRIPHEFSNCCLDGGLYVYSRAFRISRFVALPAQQIYQIVALSEPRSAD